MLEELAEAGAVGLGLEVLDQPRPARADRGPQVFEHDLVAPSVEVDCAAGWEEGEVGCNLFDDSTAPRVDNRAKLVLEPELPMLLADQVDHGQVALALGTPEAATELLREQGCGGGGPEQKDAVDVGDVAAPAEDLDGKHAARAPRLQVGQALATRFGRVLAGERDAGEACIGELPSHKVSV